jgi:hypothetical protein
MRRRRRRLLQGVGALGLLALLGLAGGLVWAAWDRSKNRVTVENRSGQPIDTFRVFVGGEPITFRDLEDGAERTVIFHARKSKDHFVVEGRLADGTPVAGKYGYVSGGFGGQRARFVLRPGGKIEFSENLSQSVY